MCWNKKTINPKKAAIPNKLPEKIDTSSCGTKFISKYFRTVSMVPEPTKSNTGNSKVLFCKLDFSSLKDAKYTATKAMSMPIIFTNKKDSF